MLRAASSTDDLMETRSTVFLAYEDLIVHGTLANRLRAMGSEIEVIDLGAEGREISDPKQCGCLVLGQTIGQMTGLNIQNKLLERGIRMPFVLLAIRPDVAEAVEAMRRGAVDVLIAPFDLDQLVSGVRQALREESLSLARRADEELVQKRIDRLSPREREVLGMVVEGRLTKQIAGSLLISTKTVETHRGHIMKKLEVDCFAHLIRLLRNFDRELSSFAPTPLSDERFRPRSRRTA